MKCPHCDEEIPGTPCPGCGESVYGDANFCMACGMALKASASPVSSEEGFLDDEEDIDFDNRELCPDGTCTGIMIGGRCSECGRTAEEMASPGPQNPEPDVEGDKNDGEAEHTAVEKRV